MRAVPGPWPHPEAVSLPVRAPFRIAVCVARDFLVIIRHLMATSFASNLMAAACAMPMGMMCCCRRPRCWEDAIQAA